MGSEGFEIGRVGTGCLVLIEKARCLHTPGGSAIEFWLSDAARADKTCGGGANITAACPAGSKPLLASGTKEPTAESALRPVGAGAGGWTLGC